MNDKVVNELHEIVLKDLIRASLLEAKKNGYEEDMKTWDDEDLIADMLDYNSEFLNYVDNNNPSLETLKKLTSEIKKEVFPNDGGLV